MKWKNCTACSTLRMWATCSSETSVEFQRIGQHYIPEDSTLRNHRCEQLKSYRRSVYAVISLCSPVFIIITVQPFFGRPLDYWTHMSALISTLLPSCLSHSFLEDVPSLHPKLFLGVTWPAPRALLRSRRDFCLERGMLFRLPIMFEFGTSLSLYGFTALRTLAAFKVS
jgi:hypothetical protein